MNGLERKVRTSTGVINRETTYELNRGEILLRNYKERDILLQDKKATSCMSKRRLKPLKNRKK